MAIVEVTNLSKVFKTKVKREGKFSTLKSLVKPSIAESLAVDNISFSVEKGECLAYLGPNGAGKSTTIKMLTGILVPTSGEIIVNGVVPHKNRIKNSYHIGVVFGQRSQLVFDLPVTDRFELLRYMYGISIEQYNKNLKTYIDLLEIGGFLNRPVRTLSLGQRMRCEMVAALLHDPEILFLDEPTIGLDVVAKERIRGFIEELNKTKKVTVMLTTHDMSDIERLCSRTIIIDKGCIIYDGTLKNIRENYANERQIRVVLQDVDSVGMINSQMKNRPNIKIKSEENVMELIYDQRLTDTSELLRVVLSYANPTDLVIKEESIESIIRRLYVEGMKKDSKKINGGIL